MKHAALRVIDETILALVPLGDELILLSRTGKRRRWTCFLSGMTLDLEPSWRQTLRLPVEVWNASGDSLWLMDAAGATKIGSRGATLRDISVEVPEGMCAAAIEPIGDDILVVLEDEDSALSPPPVVMRVSADRGVLWRTPVPHDLNPLVRISKVVKPKDYYDALDAGKEPEWEPVEQFSPRSWTCSWRELTVSGDAVLAPFQDIRSGIGYAVVLSTADGAVRFTTSPKRGLEAIALGNGSFRVGYQGYGRGGEKLDHWESQDLPVADDDAIQVTERSESSGVDWQHYHVRERQAFARLGLSLYGDDRLLSPERAIPVGPLVRVDNRSFYAWRGLGNKDRTFLVFFDL